VTKAEGKRRLKFMAEWWSPQVANRRDGNPGCLLDIASGVARDWRTFDAAERLGISHFEARQIFYPWDAGMVRATLNAIDRL
jgi:hypothetical protein